MTESEQTPTEEQLDVDLPDGFTADGVSDVEAAIQPTYQALYGQNLTFRVRHALENRDGQLVQLRDVRYKHNPSSQAAVAEVTTAGLEERDSDETGDGGEVSTPEPTTAVYEVSGTTATLDGTEESYQEHDEAKFAVLDNVLNITISTFTLYNYTFDTIGDNDTIVYRPTGLSEPALYGLSEEATAGSEDRLYLRDDGFLFDADISVSEGSDFPTFATTVELSDFRQTTV